MLQFTSQLWDSIKLIVSTQDPEGPDSNLASLASLMAHEDADTVKKAKKSQWDVIDAKKGKSRKKRSQPATVWSKQQNTRTSVESSSGDFKLAPVVGMSDPPPKRPKISKTESEPVHLLSKVVLVKAQDLDEDYDNI